jgi:tetratricopeptide (TPR) repeat protein
MRRRRQPRQRSEPASASHRAPAAPFAPWSSPAWARRTRTLAFATLAAVGLMVVCLGLQQIASVDYWWQWKTGELVAQHGPPRQDTFSFTHGGQPRIEVRWAYCWGLRAFTGAFGHAAATIVKTLAVVVMFGLAAWAGVMLATPKLPLVSTAALVAIAALACSQRLVVRPETASYLFLMMFVFGIVRLQRGPSPWLWVLPLVQVVWANVHGLFVLGPAIAGAWLVGELIASRRAADPDRHRRHRAAAVLVGATLVASCINPYGPQVLALALSQGAALGNEIQKKVFIELRSPFSFGQRFTAVVYYEVLIGLAALSALLAWRRQSIFWLLLIASQLYLSTKAIRNLPLFCLPAVPFVVHNLVQAPLLQRTAVARWLPFGRVVVAAATLVFALGHVWLVVTDRFYVRQHAVNHFGVGVDTHYFPGRAADFLAATGVDGPFFCGEAHGSYLIARGYRVFLDPRGDVYPEAFLSECLALFAEPTAPALRALARRWDLQGFVVETMMPTLVERLAALPGWRLVYLDSEAAVFLRADVAPAVPALDLQNGSEAWWAQTRAALPPPRSYADLGPLERVTNPAPYDRLARALYVLDAPALARSLYEDARIAYPPAFRQWAVLGNLAARGGDHAAAAAYYARALETDPANGELSFRAGLTALRAGDAAGALRYADAALRAAPDDWQRLALKGTAALARGDAAAAEPLLRRAITRAPEPDATLHRSLAKAEYRLGRVADAVASFETAFRYDPNDATVAADLARIHAEQQRSADAAAWADRALRIDPRNAIALQVRDGLNGR